MPFAVSNITTFGAQNAAVYQDTYCKCSCYQSYRTKMNKSTNSAQPLTAEQVLECLRAKANADRATVSQSFFKTGEGQYGFGDKFLGVTVPDQRRIARLFRAIELDQLRQLFEHELHEARLTAGLILVDKYQRTKIPSEKKDLVEFYLSVLKRINNWDIVDSTAPYILGDYALHFKDGRKHLLRLLKSNDLWEQRVAVLGELAFIRAGQVDNIFAVPSTC